MKIIIQIILDPESCLLYQKIKFELSFFYYLLVINISISRILKMSRINLQQHLIVIPPKSHFSQLRRYNLITTRDHLQRSQIKPPPIFHKNSIHQNIVNRTSGSKTQFQKSNNVLLRPLVLNPYKEKTISSVPKKHGQQKKACQVKIQNPCENECSKNLLDFDIDKIKNFIKEERKKKNVKNLNFFLKKYMHKNHESKYEQSYECKSRLKTKCDQPISSNDFSKKDEVKMIRGNIIKKLTKKAIINSKFIMNKIKQVNIDDYFEDLQLSKISTKQQTEIDHSFKMNILNIVQ